jgi:hypothetical protein
MKLYTTCTNVGEEDDYPFEHVEISFAVFVIFDLFRFY